MTPEFDERLRLLRTERLRAFGQEFEEEYRSARSHITCVLVMRLGGNVLPPEADRAEVLLKAIGDGRRCLYSCPIPPGPKGSRAEFFLFGDEDTSEAEFRRAIRPVDSLVTLAGEHLREAHVDFGNPYSGLSGWLWFCYALAWSRRACLMGYTISPGARLDDHPPESGVMYVSPESSGPAEFGSQGFRWGRWWEDRSEIGWPGINAYRLDSDIRKASSLAIEEIIATNDQWHECRSRHYGDLLRGGVDARREPGTGIDDQNQTRSKDEEGRPRAAKPADGTVSEIDPAIYPEEIDRSLTRDDEASASTTRKGDKEALVLAKFRKHPEWSNRQIEAELRSDGIDVSPGHISRILKPIRDSLKGSNRADLEDTDHYKSDDGTFDAWDRNDARR